MLSIDLSGRRGLIVGVANSASIAWGCARAARAAGAKLALTYHTDKALPHVRPLALECEADMLLPLDVLRPGDLEKVVEEVRKKWGGADGEGGEGGVDFALHSIAFAPKAALTGGLSQCAAEDFATMMRVSCHSFAQLAGLLAPLMRPGGSLLTVSYLGAARAVAGYDAMGTAKAALEATTRALALELGEKGIRANAISPGPIPTRAARGLPQYDALAAQALARAPLKRLATIEDAGALAAFLFSPLSAAITGQVIRIDGGESAVG